MRRHAEEDRFGAGLLKAFDPNAKPLPRPKHATYAPFRSPPWKIHTSVGHAKNAVGSHRWIARYEYRENAGQRENEPAWILIDKKEPKEE